MKKSRVNQVGNFGKAVSFINDLGPVYNPSKASIQVAALEALLTQAEESMKAADVSRTAYEESRHARSEVFDTVPQLSRRIISAMRANGAGADTLRDMKDLHRRFRSQGMKPAADTSPAQTSPDGNVSEVKKKRTLSQLDLDSKIGNFHRLVTKVSAFQQYKPNEEDLQLAVLEQKLRSMKSTNEAVIKNFVTMKRCYQTVDSLLYGPDGIYLRMVDIKAYVESVFGYRSDKHKMLLSLKFRSK